MTKLRLMNEQIIVFQTHFESLADSRHELTAE
jgi:hypothetical protein